MNFACGTCFSSCLTINNLNDTQMMPDSFVLEILEILYNLFRWSPYIEYHSGGFRRRGETLRNQTPPVTAVDSPLHNDHSILVFFSQRLFSLRFNFLLWYIIMLMYSIKGFYLFFKCMKRIHSFHHIISLEVELRYLCVHEYFM